MDGVQSLETMHLLQLWKFYALLYFICILRNFASGFAVKEELERFLNLQKRARCSKYDSAFFQSFFKLGKHTLWLEIPRQAPIHAFLVHQETAEAIR